MTAASAGLHEAASDLTPDVIDRHRAIVSLMEELEAIDWYDQRVTATGDAQLREILAHNRDEEKEHAAMVLEWLRRRDPSFHAHLKTYLFSTAPILEIEEQTEGDVVDGGAGSGAVDGSLGIGSLRGGNGV